MPDKQEKNNFEEWLKKVEEDEFAGNEILKAERFLAPACFHFQQMAEKLLKALLIFTRKIFQKRTICLNCKPCFWILLRISTIMKKTLIY